MTLSPTDFTFLADLLKKRSGLSLGDDKLYLIESRLLPIARARGMAGLPELVSALKLKPTEDLIYEVNEAMTTNESSFFRDIKPYEQLRKHVFPLLRERNGGMKRLSVWSAACSTGQEPYTIGMCIQEELAQFAGWQFTIMATDLARKVIDKAKLGVYSQFEAQRGLPIQMLMKYFDQQEGGNWKLQDTVRGMVQFKEQNLLADFTPLGSFDIIFCRNVLIYFDEPTKADIIRRMSKRLSPGGVLILGSTETVPPEVQGLEPMAEFRGAYRVK